MPTVEELRSRKEETQKSLLEALKGRDKLEQDRVDIEHTVNASAASREYALEKNKADLEAANQKIENAKEAEREAGDALNSAEAKEREVPAAPAPVVIPPARPAPPANFGGHPERPEGNSGARGGFAGPDRAGPDISHTA